MAATESDIGTFIRTPWGIGMIQDINYETSRYLVMFQNRTRWIDAETVLPSERLPVNLRDPEVVEKYLAGEALHSYEEPEGAHNVPCIDICNCAWCYTMSSNGFHMANKGQCQCAEKVCACYVQSNLEGA